MRRWLKLAGPGVLLVLGVRCPWLFVQDRTPPLVDMLVPEDSAFVSGSVELRAAATDSIGVAHVEFYRSGHLIGTDSVPDGADVYSTLWSTEGLTENSEFVLFARAEDYAGNESYSDSVFVTVVAARDRDIFHGSFTLGAGRYWYVPFDARAGDSVCGGGRVVGGQSLSDFFWCDAANFGRYQAQQSFTAFDRQSGQAEVAVASEVPVAGMYYVVFENAQAPGKTVWARFMVRRQ
jgi:hypothetical protein